MVLAGCRRELEPPLQEKKGIGGEGLMDRWMDG